MQTPFPGMDPYLEGPGIWQQVHAALIVDIQRFLNALLRPRYYVAIEQSTYLTLLPPPEHRTGIPDIMVVAPSEQTEKGSSLPLSAPTIEPVIAELPQPEEVKQRFLEIRTVETHAVVTTIEILSPANKVGREGREQYEQKRVKVLGSLTNLVEVDLLRGGAPMPMNLPYQKDYRIIVSRSQQRPRADAYLFDLSDIIPDFPIPLKPDEEEPILPLNQILHELYDQGGYDLMIDYSQPPIPPLSEEDIEWAEKLLSQQ